MFVKIRCDYNQTLSKFNDSFLMRAKLDSQEPFKNVRYSSTGLALMNLSQTKLSLDQLQSIIKLCGILAMT